ncbi:hypothetical protein PAXRUDRAFT_36469 [Paxillus rubicundulus Ve08.2h10]|uniref:Protein-S-isoprenylcysteine O-methyltransferase n=1 Tax=Paxillus rubicundulus Ve08.2h10 TaxID=930991 RepID=A0A0D0C8S3_9AGAM|nr:hypothetical protein PAXRUDRAFT_36469 [Paxillus rubicundulus Ve08.2h10]
MTAFSRPSSGGSPLPRLAVVMATTLALYVMTNPPNPPPDENARLEASTLDGLSLLPGMIKVVVIIMRLAAPPPFNFAWQPCAESISLDPLALFACMCGAIAQWGGFTLDLTLLPQHKLAKSGPYAILCHPLYTGAYLTLSSVTLANATRVAWAYQCGAIYSIWGIIWALLIGVSLAIVLERCVHEDKILHAEFWEEWEEWSQKVKWRMVPWVY